MDDPYGPSSSNVTGRRKRNAVDDSDEDDFRSTPLRKMRGAKKAKAFVVAPDTVMTEVNAHVDEIINKKKVGELNCFEYKSPLELYGIEKMIENNASIQEMAVVLESAQIVLGYRVDRLLNDVRAIDAALASGDMRRNQGDLGDIQLNLDNRKAKKKMAITDGISGMSEYLNQIDDDQADLIRSQIHANEIANDYINENPEETIAGEARIDPRANSKDVDLFLQDNLSPEDVIKSLASHRSVNFTGELQADSSGLVSNDDTAHDMRDSTIDFLKCNPTFQKATKGSLDNTANSFHSLNYYGIHSTTGRALLLHPRIIDSHASEPYFQSDLTVTLANNTRALLENALAKKPTVLDNYLMLEVKERPVIGRYRIMPSKETKKSVLPLAEANRERDLANLTFAEMSRARENNYMDMTVAATSDISMLPGNQGLPLAQGENDETIVLGNNTPHPNQTVPVNAQGRIISKDEYVPLPFEANDLDEALIGRLPLDPMEMAELTEMYDRKLAGYKESDSLETKLWKNGLGADEWGPEDELTVKQETRNLVSSGIDGWIKATDSWTNFDVVRMSVNKETRAYFEENAFEEHDGHRSMIPELGKNYFLMKTDEFLCGYPADRFHDASSSKMVGEELDVMQMVAVGQELESEEAVQEQLRQKMALKRAQEEDDDIADDIDIEPVNYNSNFNEDFAQPADVAEEAVARVVQREEGAPTDFFGDQFDDAPVQDGGEVAFQRNIEELATGAAEVAELMTAAPPEVLVAPTLGQREEIRNIGKTDNAHWVNPDTADQAKLDIETAQKKRREKKTQKSKKATIEEYMQYFRQVEPEERDQLLTDARCQIAEEKQTLLNPEQIYRNSLGSENKPFYALDMDAITSSGLFFKTKESIPPSLKSHVYQNKYGNVKLERVKNAQPDRNELFCDDPRGTSQSDCLAWLLTWGGFKCVEQTDADATADHDATAVRHESDYISNLPFDDDYDRYNPRHAQELALQAMGPENRIKYNNFNTNYYELRNILHARDPGEYEDDDEFDESFDRQNIQAKNLDAAKHKKCLADILNNDTLSMPSIQYALEQLTYQNNQTLRHNSTSALGGPSTSDGGEETASSPVPLEFDNTLTSVFDYQSPNKVHHDVDEIMKALTEQPDYVDDDGPNPNLDPSEPSTSEYGTRNTETKKVKIAGVHTLLSLALSMPSKMGEMVKPSSIVSFILHIANENSLRIVQDRSKRTWMSDFVVLNQTDDMPSGLKLGKMEDMGEFWKKNQDPDAIEGPPLENSPFFSRLMATRKKLTAARRLRTPGAAGPSSSSRPLSPELGAIVEEEEEMEDL